MWSGGNPLSIRRCVAVGTSNMWLTKLLRIALVVSFQALTLLCRLFLLCVRLFDRFFIFIWNGVYYSVISQKIYFYLVAAFKFFVSNEIKIMIKKVFYSGNSPTKPSSKEDCIIISFHIFVVPYDRVFYTWLSIILHILKLKPVLQCSYVKEW